MDTTKDNVATAALTIPEEKKFDKVDNEESYDDEETNMTFRSTLAQVLATVGFGCLILGVGLIFAMPTILIGGLRNATTDGFVLTENDASWFGSIVFISQPLGSVASGFLQDIFGRKVCMMAVNVPQFVGWILLYYANSVGVLYTAVAIMGLSVGFMEAPVLSYIGEVTQPHLRGVLSSITGVFVSVGLILESLMGALLHWRTMAAYSALGPAITFIILALVPDSPAWLVYKGKVKKAEKALCWLRGWVSSKDIQQELNTLINHIEETKTVKIVTSSAGDYHLVPMDEKGKEKQQVEECKSEALQNIRYFLKSSVQRPFWLILIYFFCSHCASLIGMRPFLVQIFEDMDLPMSPNWIVVFGVTIQLFGSIVLMMVMKKAGKRRISFISMTVCSVSSISLGAYITFNLHIPWIAVSLFSALFFMSACGIGPIPWILISEVFPLQGRGIAGGMSGAASYTFAFIVTKSFINLKAYIDISGTFYVYGIIGFLGLIYLYFNLPETEGKTLHDIESYFVKKKKCNTS